MNETDTLYSALGEAENHAKDLETKLAEAKLIIDGLLVFLGRAQHEGSHVFSTLSYGQQVKRAQDFIRESGR